MKKKNIAVMATTAAFLLAILPGAVMNLLQPPMVLEMMTQLGLPPHILTLTGIWKLLGAVALVAPGYPRIREWAYAGFFFDLTGAAFLHGAAGDFPGIAPALVILGLLIASYQTRRWAAASETDGDALQPQATSPA